MGCFIVQVPGGCLAGFLRLCIWIVISTYVYRRTGCIGLESIAVVVEQEMDMLQLGDPCDTVVGLGDVLLADGPMSGFEFRQRAAQACALVSADAWSDPDSQ